MPGAWGPFRSVNGCGLIRDGCKKTGASGEFSSKGYGKPVVMRYIIRDQAGMDECCEGK